MVSHISRLILGIVRFSRGNKIQIIPFTEKNNEVKLIGISVNLFSIRFPSFDFTAQERVLLGNAIVMSTIIMHVYVEA
jgi:hypothetical protein